LNANGSFLYSPNANFNGSDSFAYTASDGALSSAPALVTIGVTSVNDAPLFTAGSAQTADEDIGAQSVPGWASGISPGPNEAGQTLTFSVTSNSNPTLFSALPAISSSGTLSWTSAANANGAATITVVLSDNGGTANGGIDTSGPQTFTIAVNAVNDIPVATADTFATSEDNALSISAPGVLANDSDIEMPLSAVLVSGPGSASSFTLNANGSFSYTPNANFNGGDGFTYRASDGAATSAPITVSIPVSSVPDAPTDIALSVASIAENQPAGSAIGLLSTTDVDTGDTHAYTFTAGAGDTDNAAFQIAGNQLRTNGAFDFESRSSYSIRIRSIDSFGASFDEQFAISITNLAEGPTDLALSATSVAENVAAGTTVGSLATTDPDAGDSHTYALVAGPGDTDNALFQIAGAQLQTNAPIDFEPSATRSLRIRTTDSIGLMYEEQITVNIVDVNEAPVTSPRSFRTIGNTALAVGFSVSGGGVASMSDFPGLHDITRGTFDPDINPAFRMITFGPAAGATTKGGSFTMSPNGDFVYVPPLGVLAPFADPDTFNYTMSDGTFTTPGAVSIRVENMVYYVRDIVDANNPVGGDGRSNNAFDTLAAAEAGTPPGEAVIFVFSGNSTVTPYSTGISLKNGQKLWGESKGLSFPSYPPVVSPGPTPRIDNAAGSAITVLADSSDKLNVEISGLHVQGSVNGIEITTAGTFSAGVLMENVLIAGAGLNGLDVNQGSSGTGTVRFNNLTATAAGNGIDIQRTGGTLTVNVAGDITISGDTGGNGIVINGPATLSNSGFPSGLNVVSVGDPANRVGAAGIIFSNVRGGVIAFEWNVYASTFGISATGIGLPSTADEFGLSSWSMTPPSTVDAASGPALDLTRVELLLGFQRLTSINSPGRGISMVNVDGTFAAGPSTSIVDAAGTDFHLDGRNISIDFAGSITDDAGTLVEILNTTAGIKIFSGPITDGGDGDGGGIRITNNGDLSFASRVAFTGGMTLSTGAVNALEIVGAGATPEVEILGSSNTIATTTGTPLRVVNHDIGAGGLNFQSISTDGAPNGVFIDNPVLAAGGLMVTGTGPASSGGIIANTTGAGVSLRNVQGTSFSSMRIENTGSHGITGTRVFGLTLNNCDIIAAGNAAGEHALSFATPGAENLVGTFTLSNSRIDNFADRGLNVTNDAGTLASLIISNTQFTNNNDAFGTDAINILSSFFTQMDATITGCTFTDIERNAIVIEHETPNPATVTISGNTFLSGGGPDNAPAGGGVELLVDNGATINLDVQSNIFTDIPDDAIVVRGDGFINGRIGGDLPPQGNQITSGPDSLGGAGDGIRLDYDGSFSIPFTAAATWNVLVKNNTINLSSVGDDGIEILHRLNPGFMNATVDDNVISNTVESALDFSASQTGVPPGAMSALRFAGNDLTNIDTDANESEVRLVTSSDAEACYHLSGNDNGAGGPPGTIDLLANGTGAATITQASTAALIADNAAATLNTFGTINTGGTCTSPTLP
jgi:hypothetical protein